MSNNQLIKAEIRQTVRSKRNSLTDPEKNLAEQQLLKQLIQHNLLRNHQHIACFLSFDGEISTQKIIPELLKQQKICYLPKLKPFAPNRLWFMPYTDHTKMINNRYGIAEVDRGVNHAIAVSKLDLVLLPLVAFDQHGNRLGMGGGYYDATFAHLKTKQNRPKFIGLAYEAQKREDLPSDSWDLPLDGVCTEKAFYSF